MAVIQYNDSLSYELFDDGYDIYLNGENWISQRAPYNKVYKADGIDEENCLIQLEELVNAQNEQASEDENVEEV